MRDPVVITDLNRGLMRVELRDEVGRILLFSAPFRKRDNAEQRCEAVRRAFKPAVTIADLLDRAAYDHDTE